MSHVSRAIHMRQCCCAVCTNISCHCRTAKITSAMQFSLTGCVQFSPAPLSPLNWCEYRSFRWTTFPSWSSVRTAPFQAVYVSPDRTWSRKWTGWCPLSWDARDNSATTSWGLQAAQCSTRLTTHTQRCACIGTGPGCTSTLVCSEQSLSSFF